MTNDEVRVEDLDDPIRRCLYVARQGAVVRARKGTIAVTHDDDELIALPETLVGQVVCFGAVTVTAEAISTLAESEAQVQFLGRWGEPIASVLSLAPRSPELLRMQLAVSDHMPTRLALSRHILSGKVHNMSTLLRRFGHDDPTVREQLSRCLEAFESANSIDELMGHEGAAAAAYFGAWPTLLPEGSGFTSRQRRPPPDPVNAALGMGYTLLSHLCSGALSVAGLETSIGILHASDDSRPSLAFDLMEEFRPVIVDQVVIEAFRRRVLSTEHFEQTDRGTFLTKAGRAAFVDALESRLRELFHYEPLDRTVSYRRAIELQGRQMARQLREAHPDYRPLRWST